MPNDLNRHECIGRLGQDIELKFTPSGDAVANLSVACNKSWKDKNTGQSQDRTTWINYVAFGKLAEIMAEYLKKGSKIFLSGELRVRKWQDQSGQDRYTTEIVASEMQMLDSRVPEQAEGRRYSQGYSHQQQAPRQQQNAQQATPPPPAMDDFDDDIPF